MDKKVMNIVRRLKNKYNPVSHKARNDKLLLKMRTRQILEASMA